MPIERRVRPSRSIVGQASRDCCAWPAKIDFLSFIASLPTVAPPFRISNIDGNNDRSSAFDRISKQPAEWPRNATRAEPREQKTHRIFAGCADGRGDGQLVRLHILGTDLPGAVDAGLNSLILQAGRQAREAVSAAIRRSDARKTVRLPELGPTSEPATVRSSRKSKFRCVVREFDRDPAMSNGWLPLRRVAKA